MKNVTISQRIILLSTALMATIIFLVYSSYTSLTSTTNKYEEIIDKNFFKQDIIQKMFLHSREARINALLSVTVGATQTTVNKSIDNINKEMTLISSLIKKYDDYGVDPGESELYKDAVFNWYEYVKILEKIKSYHIEKKDDKELLYKIVHDECPKQADKLKEKFERLSLYHEKDIEINKKMISDFSEAKNTFLLIIGTISIIGGILVSLLISISTKKILASIVEKVTFVTSKLNAESDTLSSSSQQLASAAQQQASSTEEISSSLEEISGMVGATIKQANDSVKLSQEINELVSQGNTAVDNVDNSVSEIAEANKKVEKLVYLIEEIGQKTELIDEIVFQTRLLSFNASVEAERAGEHGRGFAVVAQEVGNLAQMSGKSASEISEIVKRSIREAQEVVELNKSKVNSGVQSSKEASEKLKAIYEATQNINEAVEEVLKASEEQNSGIRQINNSIQLISHSTQENATMAEQFFSGSKHLSDQGKSLTKSVKQLIQFVFGNRDFSVKNNDNDSSNVIKLSKRTIPDYDDYPKAKVSGENFHNEDDDHWDKL